LEKTIQSAASQDYPNLEINLLQFNEKAASSSIIQQYKYLLSNEFSLGEYQSWLRSSQGLQQRNGEWVLMLESGFRFQTCSSLVEKRSRLSDTSEILKDDPCIPGISPIARLENDADWSDFFQGGKNDPGMLTRIY
jgi:hypothetical protein